MNINFSGPATEHTSYGLVTLQMLKAFVEEGIDVSFFPFPTHSQVNASGRFADSLTRGLNNAKRFNPLAPSVRVWHAHDFAWRVGKGKNVGITIFEKDKFTDDEKHHLSSLDKLLVVGNFALGIAMKELPTLNCTSIQLGVDKNVFYPSALPTGSVTKFLHIGKKEYRKSQVETIDAFCKAFPTVGEAELHLLWDSVFLSKEENEKWNNYATKRHPSIFIVPRLQWHNDIANIIKQCHCMVSLSRAEGWGLPTAEGLACGRHIIATDYAGHKDYLTRGVADLIDIDSTESAQDGIWFFGCGEWAKVAQPQIDQCASFMREFHNKRINNQYIQRPNSLISWNEVIKDILNKI